MSAAIGSHAWLEDRTALFELIPNDVWQEADDAAVQWKSNPDQQRWYQSIVDCQRKHPEFDADEIRQAFECSRDDVLGEAPHPEGDEL